jgi:hypothetical protein
MLSSPLKRTHTAGLVCLYLCRPTTLLALAYAHSSSSSKMAHTAASSTGKHASLEEAGVIPDVLRPFTPKVQVCGNYLSISSANIESRGWGWLELTISPFAIYTPIQIRVSYDRMHVKPGDQLLPVQAVHVPLVAFEHADAGTNYTLIMCVCVCTPSTRSIDSIEARSLIWI